MNASPPSPSRPSPPLVNAIEHGGIRYQQDVEAARYGGHGRGGFLVATDPTTGRRLWMLQVYPVSDQSAAGVMTPGRYFRRMTLIPETDALMIENEVGGIYRVDLNQRTSIWISGPDSRP